MPLEFLAGMDAAGPELARRRGKDRTVAGVAQADARLRATALLVEARNVQATPMMAKFAAPARQLYEAAPERGCATGNSTSISISSGSSAVASSDRLVTSTKFGSAKRLKNATDVSVGGTSDGFAVV